MAHKKTKKEDEEDIEKELKKIMLKTKNESLALNKILIQLKKNENVPIKGEEEINNDNNH